MKKVKGTAKIRNVKHNIISINFEKQEVIIGKFESPEAAVFKLADVDKICLDGE